MVGKNVVSLSHEHGRKDYRVERHIVLADKMNHPGSLVFPPRFPYGLVADGIQAPLPCIGYIADGRVKPHIDTFSDGVLVLHGDGNAPIRIAGNASRPQVIDPPVGDTFHVGAPLGMAVQPFLQARRKPGQIKKPMAGLFQNGRGIIAGNICPWRHQFLGCVLGAARLALVAVRIGIPAFGAGSLDIPVRQKTLQFRGIPEFHGFRVYVTLFVQFTEELLRCVHMQRPGGTAIDIIGNSKVFKRLGVRRMITVDDFPGSDAFFQGRECNRHAVFIGAPDIQDLVAPQPAVPHIDIRRQIGARNMAQMDIAIGIRKRTGYEGAFEHVIIRIH